MSPLFAATRLAVSAGFDPAHRLRCRECFAESVRHPEQAVDLGRAALWLAAEDYPGLDVESFLAELDRLAERVRRRLGDPDRLVNAAHALRRVLADEEGYWGNTDDYYDPRNSFLNEVMGRRSGIPISLSVLYLEVAKRSSIPMEGVGLPGHFLVRLVYPEGRTLIDPFAGGIPMSIEDCAERLRDLYGEQVELVAEHLAAVGPKQILVRLLHNLRSIYLDRQGYAHALAVVERIGMLTGETPELRCQRGMLFAHLQLYGSAWADLAAGLGLDDDPFPEAFGIKAALDKEDAALRRHLEWVRMLAAAPN